MFVLDELDKFLEDLVGGGSNRRQPDRLQLSLPDVARIDVESLRLAAKMSFPVDLSPTRHLLAERYNKSAKIFNLVKLAQKDKCMSSDSLFARFINSLVLTKLVRVPERPYASAKLIICDPYSHGLLLKLKRLSAIPPVNNQESGTKNFIYKPPFSVTATFLLSDIVSLFDREREPIVLMRRDPVTGRQIANFNYTLIRQIVPYIKMTDLIIILKDTGTFELGSFAFKDSREHQILQSLNHFARTGQLVELNPLNKQLGEPHLIYDNVIVVENSDTVREGHAQSVYKKLSLVDLSFMADRLVDIASKLKIQLTSISFRAGDPFGQTKVFAQLLSTALATAKQDSPVSEELINARVLVLDRFYDLQGSLLHANRYGAFLEQETRIHAFNSRATGLRMDTVDELDEKLQLAQLTDVLSEILKYAMSLKPKEPPQPRPGGGGGGAVAYGNKSLSSVLAASRSIRRHLDLVKLVYKCLNEGYLLILKLESSLENIYSQLRSLSEPLPPAQQLQLAERLQRVASAFKQLVKLSGKSVRAVDMIRVACVLADVINTFLCIHEKATGTALSGQANKLVNEIRLSLLRDREFKLSLKSKLDPDDEFESSSTSGLLEKVSAFDRLSRETCAQRSILSLEQIVERLLSQTLEPEFYPTINAQTPVRKLGGSEVVVLVFLGSMTPDELSRIKASELALRKSQQSGDIFILASGLLTPEDFLKTI